MCKLRHIATVSIKPRLTTELTHKAILSSLEDCSQLSRLIIYCQDKKNTPNDNLHPDMAYVAGYITFFELPLAPQVISMAMIAYL